MRYAKAAIDGVFYFIGASVAVFVVAIAAAVEFAEVGFTRGFQSVVNDP